MSNDAMEQAQESQKTCLAVKVPAVAMVHNKSSDAWNDLCRLEKGADCLAYTLVVWINMSEHLERCTHCISHGLCLCKLGQTVTLAVLFDVWVHAAIESGLSADACRGS